MLIWRTPVTDRTQADIENGNEKAYLNADDLNRIEGNIDYLSVALYYEGHDIKRIPAKEWNMASIPSATDIARICANAKELADKYPEKPEPEGYDEDLLKILLETPGKALYIDDINYIEAFLFGIFESLNTEVSFNTWGDLKLITYQEPCDGFTYKVLQTIQLQ